MTRRVGRVPEPSTSTERGAYPAQWTWNVQNVVALEDLLRRAVGSFGDPVLREAQVTLLARWLSSEGVVVPAALTEREIEGIWQEGTRYEAGGTNTICAKPDVSGLRSALERIAKGAP